MKSKLLQFFRYIYHNKLQSRYIKYIIIKLFNLYKIIGKGNSNYKYYFPLSIDGKENLISKPMFLDSMGYGYFTQYYSETFIFNFNNIESIYLYKTEIYKSKYYKENNECQLIFKYDSMLPISIISDKSNKSNNIFAVTLKNNNKEFLLENLAQNRFHYLKFKKDDEVLISSKYNLLIGKPITLKQNDKKKKKLVLTIFIDAFSASLFDKYSYEELLPNTYNFFKKGVIFKKCYSNGESTLPSLSSMFCSKYVKNNNFFHPRKRQLIGIDQKIISQYFQEAGYFTQLISGNYGQNPYQGYCLGFDRTIFKHSLKHNDIVYEFLDSMRVFKDRDIFTWLSFLDIHHSLNITSSFSSGIEQEIENHNYHLEDRIKTPFRGYCPRETARYISEIKKVDYHLKNLYDYIESNYDDNEILISLVSDHASSFTDETRKTHILRREKLNVPFMIRGVDVKSTMDNNLIENVDILPILLKYSGIKYESNTLDGKIPKYFGGDTKDYIFAESLHPMQTYKATIKDNKYEAFFETKEYVNQEGSVDLSNYTFNIYRIEDDTLVKNEKVIQIYKHKILDKVNKE